MQRLKDIDSVDQQSCAAGLRSSATSDAWALNGWLVLGVAGLLVCWRSLSIVAAHSPTFDEISHLMFGAAFWLGKFRDLPINDPPCGDAFLVLPLMLVIKPSSLLQLNILSPQYELVRCIVAVWKSLLFLPFLAAAFLWCKELYGSRGACFVALALLIDPTIAAHTPLLALDMLSAQLIVIALFVLWKYLRTKNRLYLIGGAVLTGAAMGTKHTGAVIPLIFLSLLLAEWVKGRCRASFLRTLLFPAAVYAIAVALAIWAFTLFDVSVPVLPTPAYALQGSAGTMVRLLNRPLPAGIYIESVVKGLAHVRRGHHSFFMGTTSEGSNPLYFPACMAMKVPVGILLLMAAALVSMAFIRPNWREFGLIWPSAVYSSLLIAQKLNIGFRHFLPAYLLLLLLVGRLATLKGRSQRAATLFAGVALSVSFVHVVSYNPDYLSYIGWNCDRPYRYISDSNIDWGQGLKELDRWLATTKPAKPVYVRYFGIHGAVQRYVGDRVTSLNITDPVPKEGLLVISPCVVDDLEGDHKYTFLKDRKPDSIIGHSLLVFDLSNGASD